LWQRRADPTKTVALAQLRTYMRSVALLAFIVCSLHSLASEAQAVHHGGVVLADLTWLEAEAVLKPDSVVVIPLGAAAKEHGPHLRLDNDWRMAQYLAERVNRRPVHVTSTRPTPDRIIYLGKRSLGA